MNLAPIFNFSVVVFETICAIFTDNTDVTVSLPLHLQTLQLYLEDFW